MALDRLNRLYGIYGIEGWGAVLTRSSQRVTQRTQRLCAALLTTDLHGLARIGGYITQRRGGRREGFAV